VPRPLSGECCTIPGIELALQRIRVRSRRRRPPTLRELLGALWLAICLANVAHAVVLVLDGEIWQIVFAAFWIWLYVVWRRMTAIWKRFDEQGIPWPREVWVWQLGAIGIQLLATAASFAAWLA
jgi:hypothetical protein